jgi:hypothetical protein
MIKYILNLMYLNACLSKFCFVSDTENSSGTDLVQRIIDFI